MIRITPGGDGRRVSVAEVSVLGREGIPATHYAFKESPAAAFDVLARLKESVGVSLECPKVRARLQVDDARRANPAPVHSDLRQRAVIVLP